MARFEQTAHAVTVTAFLGALAVAILDKELFDRLCRIDGDDGGGLFEHLTVVLLVPAIGAGAYTLWHRRALLVRGPLVVWLLGWTLACVYFAGEEAS